MRYPRELTEISEEMNGQGNPALHLPSESILLHLLDVCCIELECIDRYGRMPGERDYVVTARTAANPPVPSDRCA